MYKLIENSDVILRIADNAVIPNDPENTDRRAYDAWIDAGNTPDAADPLPDPTYRQIRAKRYIDELTDGNPDSLEAMGDVLDVVIKELRSLRTQAGGTTDPEFAAKATIIDQIKAEVPKP